MPRQSDCSTALWSWTHGSAWSRLWQVSATCSTSFLGYANDPQFDRKEAVGLARLALSVDDGDPDTSARASVISAFMVGDSEAEIEMADRAVALKPNSFVAWRCRGHVYKIAGLPEEAIRSFERAIRISPVDPWLHFTLTGIGQALIELRRFDEAIVVLKKSLRQNSSYVATYQWLASAFAHIGRDAEAARRGGACA
jgi:adenylate cyclase